MQSKLLQNFQHPRLHGAQLPINARIWAPMVCGKAKIRCEMRALRYTADTLLILPKLVPIRLMFPPDYYASHDGVQKLAENWVDALSLWLKIKIDRIPIAEKWTASKPTNIQDGFFQVFSKVS